MSSLYILKIYYYETKFSLSEVTDDELELDELESFTEFIKIKKLDDIKIDSYLNYSGYKYTSNFLVYHHNKLYHHYRNLPITYRKPIKIAISELKSYLYGFITNRVIGYEEIHRYIKLKNGLSKSYGDQNKILIFSLDYSIDYQDDKLTIINIDNENQIWNEISKYNFIDDYKHDYLIVNKKIIKVKIITKCHNNFKIVKTENLFELIELLKNEENYESIEY